MPLVFVHGVNVREGETQAEKLKFMKELRTRNELFRTIGLAGLIPPNQPMHIANPYWGKHGGSFAYDLASIPAKSTETFGPTDDLLAQVLAETVPLDVAEQIAATPGSESALLITLARTHSLALAVDVVIAAAAVQGVGGDVPDDPGADDPGRDSPARDKATLELATFAADALAYALANPDTTWLDAKHPVTGELRFQNDSDFLEELTVRVKAMRENAMRDAAGPVETFGFGGALDFLKGAMQGVANVATRTFKGVIGATTGAFAGAVGGAAIGGAPDTLVRTLRPIATQRAGIFLGDIFAYLANRGTKAAPGEIVQVIVQALDAAVAEKSAQDDKLILVAHSMGGNIVYDVLTHYRPDIQVDLWITVGSQVALFKELGLYQEDVGRGELAAAPPLVKKPANVGAWLNVFDPLDVLGFAVEGVFENAKDFAFSNQASVLDAHTLYFFRPAFHHRLRVRMAELGFGSAP